MSVFQYFEDFLEPNECVDDILIIICEYNNWDYLSHIPLEERTIEKYKDKLCWKNICENSKLNDMFMRENIKYIKPYWNDISIYQKLSEPFITKYMCKDYFEDITAYKKIICSTRPSVFYWRHPKYKKLKKTYYKWKYMWSNISKYQKLSERCIGENKDSVNWINISTYQDIDEKFIVKYKNYVNWLAVCERFSFKPIFIRVHADYINWKQICIRNNLDENFIDEFKDLVDWDEVCVYQKLSEKFMVKHKKKLNWDLIFQYQKVSDGFYNRHKWKQILRYIKL